MDLNAIQAVIRPSHRGALPDATTGDAFLAGGTWLFSEPQPSLRRLIDLGTFKWPPITITQTGVEISATCTLAELEAQTWPASWQGAHLVRSCCRALLGSFKIWNTATVGGNICLALPAGPMTSLATSLNGTCTIWKPDGGTRQMPVLDFVTGDRGTALAPGEILRAVTLPAESLRRWSTFRQLSLTPQGRSAALLIASRIGTGLQLTITAATPRPIQLQFETVPTPEALATAIDTKVTAWHDDVHGAPDWRRHITHLTAQDIRTEMEAP
jgi:CO/xanthine dehydrogenase FAD-binding subunit